MAGNDKFVEAMRAQGLYDAEPIPAVAFKERQRQELFEVAATFVNKENPQEEDLAAEDLTGGGLLEMADSPISHKLTREDLTRLAGRLSAEDASVVFALMMQNPIHSRRVSITISGFTVSFQARMVSINNKFVSFYLQKSAVNFEPKDMSSLQMTVGNQKLEVIYIGSSSDWWAGADYVQLHFVVPRQEEEPGEEQDG